MSAQAHQTHRLQLIDHRDAESFNYAREIHKPWGELDPILTWCRSELQGEWRWQMMDMSTRGYSGRYIFYFDSERDAMVFVLKWG